MGLGALGKRRHAVAAALLLPLLAPGVVSYGSPFSLAHGSIFRKITDNEYFRDAVGAPRRLGRRRLASPSLANCTIADHPNTLDDWECENGAFFKVAALDKYQHADLCCPCLLDCVPDDGDTECEALEHLGNLNVTQCVNKFEEVALYNGACTQQELDETPGYASAAKPRRKASPQTFHLTDAWLSPTAAR
uniref:Uncharacterized protein n=1 Tax=Phaeomonas parva TaxID=124430 RepID=A0A7S1TSU7_9STRA|mmetsp:Transcript_16320/g.49872  ORF Transcript_16320/g.49872 Transcript_16320/m.49872 type:complete len:191 (+) Transcript_16320:344-916(+)